MFYPILTNYKRLCNEISFMEAFGGGSLTPEQQATFEARRAERGNFGARFALFFADPLIELLETRAGE